MRLRFTADYNHRWPSGAVTAFKVGWVGPVKRIVADQAIAKGKATMQPRGDTPPGDDERAGSVVRAHTGSNGRGIGQHIADAGAAVPAPSTGDLT